MSYKKSSLKRSFFRLNRWLVMEKHQYYIMVSVNTPAGYECFGQYTLGSGTQQAHDIFSKLKGDKTSPEQAKLHMDLVETVNELPVSVKTICCTLEEFSYNTKLIAREFFRMNALKELF